MILYNANKGYAGLNVTHDIRRHLQSGVSGFYEVAFGNAHRAGSFVEPNKEARRQCACISTFNMSP